jgi:O-antigen/teichoic acid export membrane protein
MFLKSVLKLSSATLISQLLIVGTLPILAILYLPESFAVYALYIAIVNLVSSAACLRLEHAIVIAEKRHVKSLYSISLFCSILAALCSPIIVFVASKISEVIAQHFILYLIAIPLGVLFTAIWNVNYSCGNRGECYGAIAKAQMAKNVVLVFMQLTLGYIFDVNLVMMVISHIISLLIANCFLRPSLSLHLSIKRFRFVLRKYYQFPKYSAPSIFINTFGKSSIPFFVGAAGGTIILGYYALLERVLGAPSALIGNAIGRVYYRSAAKSKTENRVALKLFDKTTLFLIFLSFIFFGVAFFVYLLDFTRFLNVEWQGAMDLLPILLPLFFLKFIVVPISMTTSVYGKQKVSLIWNFTYVITLNAIMYLVIFLKTDDYRVLLESYVACSLVFYMFLFFLLRRFIKKGGVYAS